MSNQPPHQPRPPANAHRNLIIVLAALAVALLVAVIAIVAVAVNSDDSGTDNTTASTDRVYGPPAPAEPALDENGLLMCWKSEAEDLELARWKTTAEVQPREMLLLTEQYPLPASQADLAGLEVLRGGGSLVFDKVPFQGITQFQDQTIGVVSTSQSDREESVLAVFNQDGELVGQYDNGNAEQAPAAFDLAKGMAIGGYYRVEAADGVQIPAAAAGTETNMNYALTVMPDAFHDGTFWVLMRGGSDLYKAELYGSTSHWREFGEEFGDTSQCKQ